MYWEKRLERAPKNILNDSLFREELKKTTPPPSRKGGGEQYKPTTTRPEQYKPRTLTAVFTRKRKTNSGGRDRHYKRITARTNTTLGDRIRFQGTKTPTRHQADNDNTCKSKTVRRPRQYIKTPELTSYIILHKTHRYIQFIFCNNSSSMLALLLQPSCTNVTHDNLHEMLDIMIEICIG